MSADKEESFDVIDDDNTEELIPKKRLPFIRKVYLMILFQLLITTGVIYYSITSKFFYQFIAYNPSMLCLCLAGVLLTEISILCCQSVAQKIPLNYILLLIFTLCKSYLMANIAKNYKPLSVLICAGSTLAIVIGLTLYAIFTKNDITMCGGILVSLFMILIVLTIIGIFYTSAFYQTLVNSCGLFVFSLYLIYDIQLVIGKNKYFLSTDNYIFAALMIYIDIVSLFIRILRLFGKMK